MKKKDGFTLIELMIVIAIIAIIAAIAIPGVLAAQRASNERNASASMKTFGTAQADFRANDRDNNRILDFWTADVFGLYGLIPIQGTSTALPGDSASSELAIKLIEPGLAGADGEFTNPATYSKVTVAASIVLFSPKSGYYFRVCEQEQVGTTDVDIQLDTDGTGFYGADTHDFGRYAYMAFPVARGNGTFVFMVNEDNTIYRVPVSATYTSTFAGGATTAATATAISAAADPFCAGADIRYPQSPPSIGGAKMD